MESIRIVLASPSDLKDERTLITNIINIWNCFVSITFVKLFVPETKGKTLEEIEQGFRHYNRKQMQMPGSLKITKEAWCIIYRKII